MKILICDDHKIVRDGLRQILMQLEGENSIIDTGDGNDAINLLKDDDFDIVILDISLPERSGLEILQSIKSRWPSINVLMLSMYPQEQYAIRALKLGASAYLTKDTASEELLLAVRKVSKGGKYISQSLAENFAHYIDKESYQQKHDTLSAREFEVMVKIANGKSLLEIGNELFISSKTVGTYRSRIMGKMELSKNSDLTKYCLENNLI